MDNYRANDEEDDLWMMWILQILQGPRDESNLNDCLSAAGDLRRLSPLLDTNVHRQTEGRGIGRRGTRKRRTSWDLMFFERRRISREYTRRKNNSRWTAKEVQRLVQGVSKFGAKRWTKLKQIFFKKSIRTAVNLKDKWRNLRKAYKVRISSHIRASPRDVINSSQKTTQLHLEPSLVEQIRKLLAAK